MATEFSHMTDEQLSKAIDDGWRDHWGRPSDSLALKLHRMELELCDRNPDVTTALCGES